jgi:hypothetical protein
MGNGRQDAHVLLKRTIGRIEGHVEPVPRIDGTQRLIELPICGVAGTGLGIGSICRDAPHLALCGVHGGVVRFARIVIAHPLLQAHQVVELVDRQLRDLRRGEP